MLYPVLFVVTLSLSWWLTPFAGKLAQRLGCVDRPGGRKIHARNVPYFGGLAVFLSFVLVGITVYALAPKSDPEIVLSHDRPSVSPHRHVPGAIVAIVVPQSCAAKPATAWDCDRDNLAIDYGPRFEFLAERRMGRCVASALRPFSVQ